MGNGSLLKRATDSNVMDLIANIRSSQQACSGFKVNEKKVKWPGETFHAIEAKTQTTPIKSQNLNKLSSFIIGHVKL